MLVWIKTLLYKLLDTDEVVLINDLIKNKEDKLSQPSQTGVGIMGNLVLVNAKIN